MPKVTYTNTISKHNSDKTSTIIVYVRYRTYSSVSFVYNLVIAGQDYYVQLQIVQLQL